MSQAGFVTRGTASPDKRRSPARSRSFDQLRVRAVDLCAQAADGARILGWVPERRDLRPKLIVEIRSTDVALWQVSAAGTVAIIATVPSGSTAGALQSSRHFASVVVDAIARTGASDDTTAIACADDLVLDLTLDLPIAATPQLEREIRAHIETQTPFAPGEGLACWTIERSDWTRALVEISLFPARHVAPVVEALAQLKLRPASAVRDPQSAGPVARPDWLAAADPTPMQRWRALTSLQRTIAMAAVLVTTSIAVNALTTVVATWALGERAEQARAADAVATRRLTDMRLVAGRQRDAVARVRVLDQMAERLPDTTWFDRLEIKDNKLEVVGFAPSAADTLKIVSTIAGVRNAELTASVTRDTNQNIERFRLGAEIGEGAKP